VNSSLAKTRNLVSLEGMEYGDSVDGGANSSWWEDEEATVIPALKEACSNVRT